MPITVRFRPPRTLIGVALAVALGGCGPADDRCAVSGTVTLNGQPLDAGYIMFVPVDAALPTRGSASIAGGAYRFDRATGLVPGTYRVCIGSPDGRTPAPTGGPPGPSGNFASRDRVPPQFNAQSKLEAEVRAGRPNVFDFRIP